MTLTGNIHPIKGMINGTPENVKTVVETTAENGGGVNSGVLPHMQHGIRDGFAKKENIFAHEGFPVPVEELRS